MTKQNARDADGPSPSRGGWSADLDPLSQALKSVDEDAEVAIRAAVRDFIIDYYSPGLSDQELERHRRDEDVRGAWRVKVAQAARPDKVWEFRPSREFRVLFGEDVKSRVVVFLGLIRKADNKGRQTREMQNAAKRLQRWLQG